MNEVTRRFALAYIRANNNVVGAYNLVDTHDSTDPEFIHALNESANAADKLLGDLNALAQSLGIEIDMDAFHAVFESESA